MLGSDPIILPHWQIFQTKKKAAPRFSWYGFFSHEQASSQRALPRHYNQYTTTYRPSQTTSTKCQYQAAPSKPKWCSGVKWPFSTRYKITDNMMAPMVTWKPWNPVNMKKVAP